MRDVTGSPQQGTNGPQKELISSKNENRSDICDTRNLEQKSVVSASHRYVKAGSKPFSLFVDVPLMPWFRFWSWGCHLALSRVPLINYSTNLNYTFLLVLEHIITPQEYVATICLMHVLFAKCILFLPHIVTLGY